MEDEQVIVEKKSPTFVLFGFLALACVAVVARVATGPMSTTAKVIVCGVAGALGLVCIVALIRAIVRSPGRIVISPSGITRWQSNGRWETIAPAPLRVRKSSNNWFVTSTAGTRTIGGPGDRPSEEVAGGIVLFGYDVRQFVQACAAAGWSVRSPAGAQPRPQRG